MGFLPHIDHEYVSAIPSNWDHSVDSIIGHSPSRDPDDLFETEGKLSKSIDTFVPVGNRITHRDAAIHRARKPVPLGAQLKTIRLDSADELAFWSIDPTINITDVIDYGNGTYIVEYLA